MSDAVVIRYFGDIPVGAEFSLLSDGEGERRVFTKLDGVELSYLCLDGGVRVNAFAPGTTFTAILVADTTPVQVLTPIAENK